MSHLTVLIGTCNTIAGILCSIRNCRKPNKNINPLPVDVLTALGNVKNRAAVLSVFVELGGIEIGSFWNIAGRIVKLEEELAKHNEKLRKMNKLYKFVSASERVMTLSRLYQKWNRMNEIWSKRSHFRS